MPERSCSAIRAEVKKPSAHTTSTKGGRSRIGGIILGSTKYQMNTCTSRGMLRNSSTQALPKRTSHGLFGSVRSVPMIEPTTSATNSAVSATLTVQPQAWNIHCR